jgi:uncharacterized protein (TIGR02246 family)
MTRTTIDEVLAANAELYAAFEAADLDRMAGLWLDDGDVSCVHPGWLPIRGRAAVLRSFAAIMAGTTYIQFFLTDVSVDVAGDTALVTCTENILSAGEGMPETTFAGARAVATNVFRRTPDGWRLWAHHGSPVIASDDEDPGQDPA